MIKGFGNQETMTVAAPAAPASAATVTLFDSQAMFGKGVMRSLNLTSIDVVFIDLSHDSGANGFVPSAMHSPSETSYVTVGMPDGAGTQTAPVTISATSAGVTRRVTLDVTPYVEFKIAYTNSANTLTAWKVSIVLTFNGAAVQR